ncbi:MAG: histidinol-phosphate transaminase [Halieaceae bacterium]|jgi:histidinol-phosphate aminotransferase|nr:histidinol-phosphate transaminase [Halieaceae bacterium]
MSRFWTARTAALTPYVPGEQPATTGLIKLNTNEHPMPPSQVAIDAMAAISGDALRRYPDPTSRKLRLAIADSENLELEQVFVGNGSDEVLATVFMALLAEGPALTVPDITYSFYPVWAKLYQVALRTIPLKDDFTLDVEALCKAPGPVLIANPNAPTGIALSRDEIRRILESDRDRLLIVDEAYFGFGAETAAPLIDDYDNLLITRTLSKSHALAGLRLGYALGNATLIEGLVRVKDSFNSYPVDVIAERVAEVAVGDRAWLQEAGSKVAAWRDELRAGLEALGFEVLASRANFVFARHPQYEGRVLFDALRAKNIIVRRWDKPRLTQWLRITVGTPDQNQALLDALRQQCPE